MFLLARQVWILKLRNISHECDHLENAVSLFFLEDISLRSVILVSGSKILHVNSSFFRARCRGYSERPETLTDTNISFVNLGTFVKMEQPGI